MLPTFALDIDGCAANFIAHSLVDINEITGREHQHDDVDHFMIEQALKLTPYETERFYACVKNEGWCRSIPPYADAPEIIQELREYVAVHPVTAPFESKHWVHERLAWILEHLQIPKHDVVQTDAKYLVLCDYFVDDRTSTLIKHRDYWRRRGHEPVHILFSRKYNENDEWDGVRVASWPELKGFVMGHLASSRR